ncbi:DinB family protein [Rugamonas apoptosis]|uniref:DinB family protein n=1 Tax=Rugamonas apoptosis TaxID=2758570 RepID=A0A7W2FD90_9BURK|nr:DinB family protein [Rugamonas apoptosis]MBA5689543.1 DinB family protein [Rugamonas apoptosis]
MSLSENLTLLADYNAAMNQRMYEAAAQLPEEELLADRRAFFGSILGTLNHLVVGDTLWLQRFASHPAHFAALAPIRAMPAPTALTQMQFYELGHWHPHRMELDAIINAWVREVREEHLGHVLEYTNTKGVLARKRMSSLVLHFFNHQTHHRGQVTTMLSQAGIAFGVTDLLAGIPDE